MNKNEQQVDPGSISTKTENKQTNKQTNCHWFKKIKHDSKKVSNEIKSMFNSCEDYAAPANQSSRTAFTRC